MDEHRSAPPPPDPDDAAPPAGPPPHGRGEVWGLVGWGVLFAVAVGLLLLRALGGGC